VNRIITSAISKSRGTLREPLSSVQRTNGIALHAFGEEAGVVHVAFDAVPYCSVLVGEGSVGVDAEGVGPSSQAQVRED